MPTGIVFTDPALPAEAASLIAGVPADLLPDALAEDVPERAPWAGKPPKSAKDGDSYRWLQYGTGWRWARQYRGRYVLATEQAIGVEALALAARLHQAAEGLDACLIDGPEAVPDGAELALVVPVEVYDIACVLRDAGTQRWTQVRDALNRRVEQVELLAETVQRAAGLAAALSSQLACGPEECDPFLEERAAAGATTAEVVRLTARANEAVEVLSAGDSAWSSCPCGRNSETPGAGEQRS